MNIRMLVADDHAAIPAGQGTAPGRGAARGSCRVPPHIGRRTGSMILPTANTRVFGCLGSGMSNTRTGSRLHIGETTVKTHMSRVLARLGVRSRVLAAILAKEYGLVAD